MNKISHLQDHNLRLNAPKVLAKNVGTLLILNLFIIISQSSLILFIILYILTFI